MRSYCECGAAAVILVNVTSHEGVLLDRTGLCRTCLRSSSIDVAIQALGIEIGPIDPSPETLEWEGVTWTKTDANLPITFKCDGCAILTHEGTFWVASNGNEARWCGDCLAVAKGRSR